MFWSGCGFNGAYRAVQIGVTGLVLKRHQRYLSGFSTSRKTGMPRCLDSGTSTCERGGRLVPAPENQAGCLGVLRKPGMQVRGWLLGAVGVTVAA